MAKKVTYILLLFFAVVNIYAQSTLSFTANNPDLSKANVQMELALNLNDNADSLLYIILPEKLEAVPLSVQKNNNNLWLKNSNKKPDKEASLSWKISDNNTLIFRFLTGTIVSGDVIKIVCMVKYRGKPSQDDKISVKTNQSAAVITEVLLNTINR